MLKKKKKKLDCMIRRRRYNNVNNDRTGSKIKLEGGLM